MDRLTNFFILLFYICGSVYVSSKQDNYRENSESIDHSKLQP